jgi:hypothetical protein
VFAVGLWAVIGNIRLLSLHPLTIPQNAQFNFGDPSFIIFPAAYVSLVFGILYIKNGLRVVRIQQAILEPKPVHPQKTPAQQGG